MQTAHVAEPSAPPAAAASSSSGPVPAIDLLRVLATVAVVVLHVASNLVYDPARIGTGNWWAANVVNAYVRWCVPVFVMISGYLLLSPDKTYGTGEFYRRRLARLGVPVVAWTVIYFVWRETWGNEEIGLRAVVWSIAIGNPEFHLYFLFLIFGLYLFTPALRTFVARATAREQLWAGGLALGVAVADDVVHLLVPLKPETVVSHFVPFVGYYVLGHALPRLPLTPRWRAVWWTGVAVVPLVAAVALGWLATHGQATRGFLLLAYLSPFVAWTSLGVFVLAVRAPVGGFVDRLGRSAAVRWTAPATLGVYLLHPIVMDVTAALAKRWEPTIALYLIGWTAVTLALTVPAVLLVQRVPYVRRIMG